MPKTQSIPSLTAKAQKVFNTWIRKRDSQDGYFTCISCGQTKSTDQMHAGHYLSAGHHTALRFNEVNTNGQCVRCNLHLHGNQIGYRNGLIRKYGEQKVLLLEGYQRIPSKLGRVELQAIIEKYKL